MTKKYFAIFSILAAVCGCAGDIPYRHKGFSEMPECRQVYEQHTDDSEVKYAKKSMESVCWDRSCEERSSYDLLFVEFDDQGWVQGTADRTGMAQDHLDALFKRLNDLRVQYKDRGLLLIVFVHGWHHNADANDGNVRNFRKYLRDTELLEGKDGRRVVGLYVGWRGESVTFPGLDMLTFWDRKNTAERVAQGSVREFFSKLDSFHDVAQDHGDTKGVRMMTIGHSFGGLVTFEALSSEFLRDAARYKPHEAEGKERPRHLARFGDLVIIVNPAFEGVRYEPVKTAGLRLPPLEKNQLPLAIVATSTADWATGKAFPAARFFNGLFESSPGEESKASRRTVGHNDRYTTHRLFLCTRDDADCWNACAESDEVAHMASITRDGIQEKEYLCDGLRLTTTPEWAPLGNPYWVVETTGDLIGDHNDIFNPNFVSFIRQMYLATITATEKKERKRE
jgi:hypothetical protein